MQPVSISVSWEALVLAGISVERSQVIGSEGRGGEEPGERITGAGRTAEL